MGEKYSILKRRKVKGKRHKGDQNLQIRSEAESIGDNYRMSKIAFPHAVIASVAKQSLTINVWDRDCFVAALLAMTAYEDAILIAGKSRRNNT
jgi:hypothetical protein